MVKEKPVIEDGYEELAHEVVRQAVDDYRQALQFKTGKGISERCKKYIERFKAGEDLPYYYMANYINPYLNAEGTIEECERFFRSEMELYAPGVSGEAIIDTIRKRFSSDIPSYYEDNK